MIAIIIGGGAGTRLWPLSTSTEPKQFLKIDETGRSLIQQTYDRIAPLATKVYAVTSAPILDTTKEQLPEIGENIVCEPSRRGIANALYLGIRAMIKDGIGENEPIFILWSDHLIRDTAIFSDCVAKAVESVRSGTNLVQFGVEPTHASTQLGYIKKGSESDDKQIYSLEAFKYQPDQKTANEWYRSGEYLWNTGYFVSTRKFIMQEIQRESPDSYAEYLKIVEASDESLDDSYNSCEIAILDHVFSEKMKNASVIACNFDWTDVGNYHDLHAASIRDNEGNFSSGNVELVDSKDCYIRNETDDPLAVIGLESMVVVKTDHGTIVTSKLNAKAVGDVAKKIQA